jgi:hypothetical protein
MPVVLVGSPDGTLLRSRNRYRWEVGVKILKEVGREGDDCSHLVVRVCILHLTQHRSWEVQGDGLSSTELCTVFKWHCFSIVNKNTLPEGIQSSAVLSVTLYNN